MGKRLLVVAMVGIGLVLPALAGRAAAQNVQDFTINDFTADYYLDRGTAGTATLHTTEAITAQFPSYNQNHGILRAIPLSYLGHTVSLQIDSVTDGLGTAQPYSTYRSNGNLVLKIGDAGTYVHGVKVYKIAYDQRNVVSIQSNTQQFYWDVNGDQWSQPFTQVTARLHIPPSLITSLQSRRECFVGGFGAGDSSRCTTYSIGSSGSLIITSQASGLQAGQTMTIIQAFKAGTFRLGPEIKQEQLMKRLELSAGVGLAVGPPIAAGWVMFRRWRAFGDDPKGRGVIIPQYEPPKGLDTMQSDFILKEQFRAQAFSALLIGLATGGYITIYEIPKKGIFGKIDYELELNKLPAVISAQATQGLGIIFGPGLNAGSRVKVSDLRKPAAAQSNAKRFQDLGKDLSAGLAALGYFIKDPLKTKRGYQSWSAIIFGVGLFGFVISAQNNIGLGFGLAGGLVLAGAVTAFFARYMPARTVAGVMVHDELLGLRDYIKLAEADRLNFLQSPEGAQKVTAASLKPNDPKFKVKLFESLLPYAMLFGLEKQWAKQFKDIYTTPPDWYQGNWSTFNTAYLASSISSFSAAGALSFSPPSSSGGGGGFAGGGGGGGGGGGW